VAAWRSGNAVGRINEVTLRRARLVLGWVTMSGVRLPEAAGTLFRHVTMPPKANLAFHRFGVDKLSSEQLYRMRAGRAI